MIKVPSEEGFENIDAPPNQGPSSLTDISTWYIVSPHNKYRGAYEAKSPMAQK
jgi:hypothetical protein